MILFFSLEHYHQTFFAHNNAVVDVKWSPQDELLVRGFSHVARVYTMNC